MSIIEQMRGEFLAEAEELLGRCDGELKVAIVTHQCGVEPDEARKRLAQAGGQLRLALGDHAK